MSTTTDEGTDAAALSTQPKPVRGRATGPIPFLRNAWRRLTSMRTALILLFLLALAAVPGSLLPQRPLNQSKVDRYFTDHPTLAPFLDRFGLFDVFASPWFAAIYLLLFVSLIGCLVPRTWQHARALFDPPPKAPRRLSRLPESTEFDAAGTPEEVAVRARRALRGHRTKVRTEPDGVVTVAAEKGYLRETGNLIFHIALTVLLAGVAMGKLWGYQGTVLLTEGEGFCNSIALYDSFRPGHFVDGGDLTPFCVDDLSKFTATYNPDGSPDQFTADITYSTGVDGTPRPYSLKVNSPLRIDGVRVYLLSHGFAPRFTVTLPSGQVVEDVSVPFLPQNGQLLSEGVVKLPDTRPQLAIYGLFAPTAIDAGNGEISSLSARPDAPAVAVMVYSGNLGLDSGRPQSVYSVDQTQIDNKALKDVGRGNLVTGQTLTLDDGTKVRFDGYREWASVQVSRDPGQRLALGAAVAIVVGLMLSLAVRRRRVWLRIRPAERGSTVEVGGLARTDANSFTEEFERLSGRVRDTVAADRRKD